MHARWIARCLLAPLLAIAGGGALAMTPIVGTGSAGATHVPHKGRVHHTVWAPHTVYVSASSHPRDCGPKPYTTIQAAVSAVPAGGRVVVCAGTYSEDVTVSQAVTIVGQHAVVEPAATDTSAYSSEIGNNAFTVVAPHVTITGFTVKDATGDGILTIADYTRLTGNRAIDNGGTGFDLNGTSRSVVANDVAEGNTGGGVYLTDDLGTPDSHDTVADNVIVGNPGGCGVILADHTGAGIYDNLVVGNLIKDNGTDPASVGSGVIFASPEADGAVYDNVVTSNRISGNGLAGVTLHNHFSTGDFSGNVVVGNDIGTNNVLGETDAATGEDDGDAVTSGVYLGSLYSLTITVARNTIHDDEDGIYAAGTSTSTVTVNGATTNRFVHVTNDVVSLSDYVG